VNEDNEYDFVLEAVGTPSAISKAIFMTRPGGRLVLMGNPSGEILLKQDVYWRVLRKQLHICGTWNSSYDGSLCSDWTDAVTALIQGNMNVEALISHCYNQEELMDGLALMRDKKEPYCKVMTIWNS
jgi:L-iditol 2-dehydrogenase